MALGQAGQLLLAEAKTNKVLEMRNWLISTFSEGNVELWKARSLECFSNFHNAEEREMVAHPSLATQSYILVFIALI